MNTKLSNILQLPELNGTLILEIEMKSFPVIKDFDIFEKIRFGHLASLIDFVVDAFYFQCVEKIFDHRVIVIISF